MEPTRDTSPDEVVVSEDRPPKRRRWPLGTLTLIVIAVIGGGVLLLDGNTPEPPTTVPTPRGAFALPTQDGEVAPDFSLVLLDGTEFQLAEHFATDGRPVLLNLWASWCFPCRAEMPALDAASKVHTDVLFLGVAVEDDPIAAKQFAAEIGVSYPLAIDETGRVARSYPSPGLPTTYFIGSDGVIIRTVFGQVDEADIDQFIAESFGL